MSTDTDTQRVALDPKGLEALKQSLRTYAEALRGQHATRNEIAAELDRLAAYLSSAQEGREAVAWTDEQIARFGEALCAEDPGDPIKASGPKLEALARHVLDYVFRDSAPPQPAAQVVVKGLEWHPSNTGMAGDAHTTPTLYTVRFVDGRAALEASDEQ